MEVIKKPLQSRKTGKDDKVDDRQFSATNALRRGRSLMQRQGRLCCGFSVRMCHGLGSKWEDDVFGCESCGSGSHFKWISPVCSTQVPQIIPCSHLL